MIDLLIENFEDNFLSQNNADYQDMVKILANEWEKINNADHLEQNVIGKPQFEWDFRVLKEGFEGIILPFSEKPSYIPIIFLQCLRDFGCTKDEYKQALIFSEYSHLIITINDYFNCQEVFTHPSPELSDCARLTQVKYAGQFVSTYPSYLLIENTLGLSDEMNIKVHKLLLNITASVGMSRGVFAKWVHRNFADITTDAYAQNSINSISHCFVFPVILAAILSSVSDEQIALLKKAFSHFTLFAKLRLERKMVLSHQEVEIPDSLQSYNKISTFPGMVLINSGLSLESEMSEVTRFPYFAEMYDKTLHLLRSSDVEKALAVTEDLEKSSFNSFIDIMSQTGLLEDTVKKIQKSFTL